MTGVTMRGAAMTDATIARIVRSAIREQPHHRSG